MTRNSWIQLGAAIVLVLSLAASTQLAISLTTIAGRNKLTYTDRAEDGQPNEVAVGIALGAFRGIFVNFLWMRANTLKEAGKFYEAIELASYITRLQPRFPRVWVFHAWNMAYNISVTTQTAEERWNWVNAGIALLRDKGIPANPNDLLLHKELGWIFLHKIGGYTDDANPFYKRRLAAEWTAVLGPPPDRGPEDRNRAAAISKYVAWLRIVADAPMSLDDVKRDVPEVATLVSRLSTEVNVDFNVESSRADFLTRYEVFRAVRRSPQRAVYESGMGDRTKALATLVDDPALKPAWDALIPHLRRRLIVEHYHMEPERMIAYTEKYGPMDWRHHASHSLYWAQKGVDATQTRWTDENKRDFDFLNTDRIVAQSIQDLFRSGEMYFDYVSEMFGVRAQLLQVPSAHFVESYAMVVDDEMRKRSWADSNARFSPLTQAYENFVRDAVLFFYRRGDLANAEKWRNVLLTYKFVNLNDPYRKEEVSLPLPEFVNNELNDRLTSPSVAVSQVTGALMGAYASGLLAGDEQLFRAQFDFARTFHKRFFEYQARTTSVDRTTFRMEQLDSDFRLLAGSMFYQFMEGLSLDDAERVYDTAPNDLKLFAYAPLQARFKQELTSLQAQGARSFDSIFPEPDNWEAFKAELTAMEAQRKRTDTALERK